MRRRHLKKVLKDDSKVFCEGMMHANYRSMRKHDIVKVPETLDTAQALG